MQKNSENFSLQDVMRLVATPAGQQLIALLRQGNTEQLQQAARLASEGDPARARELLSGFLSDPAVRDLLAQLGG